ncbi:MAG: lipoyl(octanoyl) transferase LipB [Betaproteobacteria bacterium]|nr:lipoyl(octanoyl) transferase LipB [Betaproteobacteria bacterium]MBI4293501.1 lipoyl(octanoyl) transferase LipB [Betaproteobacteria bacterium]
MKEFPVSGEEITSSPRGSSQSPILDPKSPPIIRRLGVVPYRSAYEEMRRFTSTRTPATPDELWIVQHPAVYTVGIAGRPEHFPKSTSIALERIDRGGQITYHGPGQVLVYTLLDMTRQGLKVRELVHLLEQAAIDMLDLHGIRAERRSGAPGVYVDGAKIAALGLRVRAGRCYHGIALNVDMDLAPFLAIDPCGYPGLRVTQTSALGIAADPVEMGEALAQAIARLLGERHG